MIFCLIKSNFILIIIIIRLITITTQNLKYCFEMHFYEIKKQIPLVTHHPISA